MVAHDRQPLFGKLIHTGAHAMVEMSELGWVLIENLAKTKRMCPEVRILNNQVMPDHFHLVLYVTQTSSRSIRQLMRGYMQGCKASAREITYVSDNPRRAWIKELTRTALMQKAQSRGKSYTELPTSSSRFRFMALNEIGRLLVEQ